MAKAWFGDTTEYSGPVPAGGYKCVIESIERGVTGERSNTPGAKQYTARLRIVEPKKNAGTTVMDWFTVGTEEDPKARDQATWQGSLGAKKLYRLLKRAGVAARDGDDEEWMDAAQGQEVCAHVSREVRDGQARNRINGDYFKESDEDFVGVGEPLEAPSADGRGAKGSPRAGGMASARAAKPQAARARPPVEDDDDADAPPVKAQTKPPVDEEEEQAAPARKGGRKVAAKAAEDDDDDDED